ncbi:uncharacterized protein LOC133270894 [Pezoporus flaviventris]|uniref:uncharacterized protein LOC133270894 n=1 Tax=Pezoporus flaviventris TaxID=889875 RepID=UPI002AB06AB2|nr:uncharacterized protein LOC133270894 [Pezoporus flaviventris]
MECCLESPGLDGALHPSIHPSAGCSIFLFLNSHLHRRLSRPHKPPGSGMELRFHCRASIVRAPHMRGTFLFPLFRTLGSILALFFLPACAHWEEWDVAPDVSWGFSACLMKRSRLVLELVEAGLSTNLVQNSLKLPQLMKLGKVQLWPSVSSLAFWQWWKHGEGETQTSPIGSGSHRELLSRKQRSAEPRALGVNRLGAVLMARAGCASGLVVIWIWSSQPLPGFAENN